MCVSEGQRTETSFHPNWPRLQSYCHATNASAILEETVRDSWSHDHDLPTEVAAGKRYCGLNIKS